LPILRLYVALIHCHGKSKVSEINRVVFSAPLATFQMASFSLLDERNRPKTSLLARPSRGNFECMTVTLHALTWRAYEGCNMIVEELYDALIEAGASEEKARAASRAMADMQGYFTNLQTNIQRDISRLEQKISEVDGRLRLHDWMLGTILAFLVAIFFKVFSH
jgi:hypothetical protein